MTLFLILFLIYLDPPAMIGGVALPGVAAPLIIGILFINGKLKISTKLIKYVILYTLVSLFIISITSSMQTIDKILSSYGQTTISLVVGYFVSESIKNSSYLDTRKGINYSFYIFWIFGILEFIGLLSGFSKSFGELVYSQGAGFSFYGSSDYAEARDIELAGWRRPTIFSPEPSVAAIGLSVVTLLHGAISKSKLHIFIHFLLIAIIWFIFKSPIPLMGGVAYIVYLLNRVESSKSRRSIAMLAVFIFFLMLGGLYFRVEKIFNDTELIFTSSEGIRLILPFENLIGAYMRGEIIGVGPGAASDYSFIASLNKFKFEGFGTNAFAQIFMYYGILFSPILIYYYWKLISERVNASSSFGIVCFIFVSFSLGAVESLRVVCLWCILCFSAYKFK